MKVPIYGKRGVNFSDMVAPVAVGLCWNCGESLKNGRQKKYCSEECANEFTKNHNWRMFLDALIKKRGEYCELCGVHPCVEGEYRYSYRNEKPDPPRCPFKVCKHWGQKRFHLGGLAGHHIKRIIDGGELCNEDNVIILCQRCHGLAHRDTQSGVEVQERLF